jgi:hypothetical protein
LKTLEKIKRKAIGNSSKLENLISAQISPAGPDSARVRACALALPNRRPLPVGPLAPAHSSLSLAVRWGRPVGAKPIHARALALSILWSLSVSVETRSIACPLSDPWGPSVGPFPSELLVPCPRNFWSCPPHARAFSGPCPCSLALPHSVAPSAEQPRPLSRSTHPGSSAAARRGLAPVLRSPSSHRHVCCLGKLRLITRNPGHPSAHPLPLWFAWSALTGAFLAQPESRRCRLKPCHRVPAAVQGSQNLSSR